MLNKIKKGGQETFLTVSVDLKALVWKYFVKLYRICEILIDEYVKLYLKMDFNPKGEKIMKQAGNFFGFCFGI